MMYERREFPAVGDANGVGDGDGGEPCPSELLVLATVELLSFALLPPFTSNSKSTGVWSGLSSTLAGVRTMTTCHG